jgi:hypothetical protein
MSMNTYQSLDQKIALLIESGNGIRAAGAGAAIGVYYGSYPHGAAAFVAYIERLGVASASQPALTHQRRVEAAEWKLPVCLEVRVARCAGASGHG